jgi:hypothetical protein
MTIDQLAWIETGDNFMLLHSKIARGGGTDRGAATARAATRWYAASHARMEAGRGGGARGVPRD